MHGDLGIAPFIARATVPDWWADIRVEEGGRLILPEGRRMSVAEMNRYLQWRSGAGGRVARRVHKLLARPRRRPRFTLPERIRQVATALRFRQRGYAPSVATVHSPEGLLSVITRGRGRLAQSARVAAGLADIPVIEEPDYTFTSYHPAFDGMEGVELEEGEEISTEELAGLFDFLKKAGGAITGFVKKLAPGARVEARVGPMEVDLTDPEQRREALEALQTAARATEITITRPASEEAEAVVRRGILQRFAALPVAAKVGLGVGVVLLLKKVF